MVTSKHVRCQNTTKEGTDDISYFPEIFSVGGCPFFCNQVLSELDTCATQEFGVVYFQSIGGKHELSAKIYPRPSACGQNSKWSGLPRCLGNFTDSADLHACAARQTDGA